MFYVKFNKESGQILGCINYQDNSFGLIEIDKQQYVDFMQGKLHLENFEIKVVNRKFEMHEKEKELYSVSYDNLFRLQKIESDILIKRIDNKIHIILQNYCKELHSFKKIALYVTEINNPLKLIATINVDVNDLLANKQIEIKILNTLPETISIYTRYLHKNISMSFTND